MHPIIDPREFHPFFVPDGTEQPNRHASPRSVREFAMGLPVGSGVLLQTLAAEFDERGYARNWRNPFCGKVHPGGFVLYATLPDAWPRVNRVLIFGVVEPGEWESTVRIRLEPCARWLSSDIAARVILLGAAIVGLAALALSAWHFCFLGVTPQVELVAPIPASFMLVAFSLGRSAMLEKLLNAGEAEIRKWLLGAAENVGVAKERASASPLQSGE